MTAPVWEAVPHRERGPRRNTLDGALAHDDRGSGPMLVFLHGITANRAHWGPVVERLTDRFRCVNVDLLGHGASPPGESTDLFGQIEEVASLLDELAADAPVLVGHSYGGMIATFAATARRVRGVVNVDQRFDTSAFRSVIEPLADRLRGDCFPEAFAEFVETQRPDLVPPERQELTRGNLRPDQRIVIDAWTSVLDTPPDELLGQVRATLPAVAAPYLGLFGTSLSDEERALQALIPDSRVEVWDGQGHFLHLVDPDRTADGIARFVASLGD